MEKRSAWFVNETINNRRINEAADELASLHQSHASAEDQVLRLLALDREQQQSISKLESVVFVLIQMLTENGTLDGADMDVRIKASFAALERNPEWKRMRGR